MSQYKVPTAFKLVFKGYQAKQILSRFEWQCKEADVDEDKFVDKFVNTVADDKVYPHLIGLPSFDTKDWTSFKKEILSRFIDQDVNHYSTAQLDRLVDRMKAQGGLGEFKDITRFYLKFSEISKYLIKNGSLSKLEESKLFCTCLNQSVLNMLLSRSAFKSYAKDDGREEHVAAYSERMPDLEEVIEDLRAGFSTSSGYASVAQKVFAGNGGNNVVVPAPVLAKTKGPSLKRHGRGSQRGARQLYESDSDQGSDDNEVDPFDDFNVGPKLGKRKARMSQDQAREDEVDSLSKRLEKLEVAQASARTKPSYQHANYHPTEQRYTPGILPDRRQGYQPGSQPARRGCNWCGGPHFRRECHSFTQAVDNMKVRLNDRGIPVYIPTGSIIPRDPQGFASPKSWFIDQESKQPDSNSQVRKANAAQVLWEPPSIQVPQGSFQTRVLEAIPEEPAGYESEWEHEVNVEKRTRDENDSSNPAPRSKRRQDDPPQSKYQPPRMRVEADDPPRQRPRQRAPQQQPTQQAARATPMDIDKHGKPEPKSRTVASVADITDGKEAVNKILQQEISLPISHLLSLSLDARKAMVDECRSRRVAIEGEKAAQYDVARACYAEQEEDDENWQEEAVYYAGVLSYATGTIKNRDIPMLIDGGSQISVISDDLRKRLGLPLRVDGKHYIKGIQGQARRLLGICENTTVLIGGIEVNIHFFVSENPSQEAVLGQGVLVQTEASMDYHKHGLVEMTLRKDGRVVTLCVTRAENSRYLRLVPGLSGPPPRSNRHKAAPSDNQESDECDDDDNNNQSLKARGQAA